MSRWQEGARRLVVPGAVFLLALCLRAAVLWQGAGHPLIEVPLLDARFYLESGQALAAGAAWPDRPFFMSPGYQALVALFARVRPQPVPWIGLFQAFLDALTCAAGTLLAVRLGGLAAGLVAGIALALNGPLILASTRLLPETVTAFLLVALAIVLVRAGRSPRRRWWPLAGLLLGLGSLLRGNVLLLLPALLLLLILREWRAGSPTRAAGRSALLVAGVAAALLPVVLHNVIRGGEPVLLTTNGGVNFYLGNARGGDGRFVSLNQLPLAPGFFDDDPAGGGFERTTHAYAELRAGRSLSASEASGFWWREGGREIAAAPGRWAWLLARKVFLAVNGFELPQVENLEFAARDLPVLRGVPTLLPRLLWPLGLLGIVLLACRGVTADAAWVVWLFAAYMGSVVLFFVTARHRVPVVPLLGVLAGCAVVELVRRLRTAPRRTLPAVLLLLGLLVFCNLGPGLGAGGPWLGVPADYRDFASQHNNLATALLERGDAAGAEAEARRGLESNPEDPSLWFNLAVAQARRGDGEAAQASIRRSLERHPADAAAWTFLGELLLEARDPASARGALEEALRLDPDAALAWLAMGVARTGLDDVAGAERAYRRAIDLRPDWGDPRARLIRLLDRNRRHADAVTEARRFLEVLPADPEAAAALRALQSEAHRRLHPPDGG